MILQQKTLEILRDIINEKSEYRTGPKLVSFFNNLGFKHKYGQGFPSRKDYTDNCLKIINGKPELDNCIKSVFAVINFIGRINQLDELIVEFNQYLSLDRWKIERNNDAIIFIKTECVVIKNEQTKTNVNCGEDDFLNKEFAEVEIESLGYDDIITNVLNDRLAEIKISLKNDTSLSSIFLIGSTLEGVLLANALKFPRDYNESKCSPVDPKTGKIKQFHLWSLNNFIDVSCDIGFIKEDVKKFSHVLRDFRNYIHPYEQMSSHFFPSKHTADICWQVFKAAIYQIKNNQ